MLYHLWGQFLKLRMTMHFMGKGVGNKEASQCVDPEFESQKWMVYFK